MAQIKVIGLPWYRRENWVRLKALFTDGEKLHRTYDEWLAAAEQGCQAVELDGHRAIRIDIDPDTFAQWCKAKGFQPDAEARRKFATLMAVQNFSCRDVN